MKDSKISLKKFKESIELLEDAFRVNSLTEGQLKVYRKYLQDLSDTEFEKGISKIIQNDNFFPSIARIREASGANSEPPPKALSIEDIERMSS